MKLRNKKTGGIVEISRIGLVWNKYGMPSEIGQYDSLDELIEEWEDYTPTEPLIKDEKIRNLVREWTGLWETENRWYVCDSGEILIARGDIELCLPLSYGIKDGYYTIAELCGEE